MVHQTKDCWSLEDMNTESRAIISAIQKGLQLFAPPPSGQGGKPSGVEWWTQKIGKLNARLKSIREYLRKWLYRRMARNLPEFTSNDMKYSWEDLKTARLQFKKACRKAKKKALA